jgi:predicted Zn-dependent protease with MMP-like domain
MDYSDKPAPDLADIEALGRAALAAIPEELRRHLGDVVIRVEDFPSTEVMAEMGLQSPFDILGLYQGISLNNKSVLDTPTQPDMIFLYRRPLLDYCCETGHSLGHVVRHVLIHEVGHHFGFSDGDMEVIERTAE